MDIGSVWGFLRQHLCRGAQRIESRPPADIGRSYVASLLCILGSFNHISVARNFTLKSWKGESHGGACR